MSAKQITVYTPAELKAQFPEAYKKVCKKWADIVAQSGDIAWADETMASYKAVVEKCGGKLAKWEIGAFCPCTAQVTGIDDDAQGRSWFLHNVLKPLGYTHSNGHAYFPGNCALTGYCADDDFLEAAWKALGAGRTLTQALEGLASNAGRKMEEDLEQEQDEESMLANWEDKHFTENGVAVD